MDVLLSLSVFSGRIAVTSGNESIGVISAIKPYIYNVFGAISTNIFRFNPILLVVFLGALPIFILNLINRKDIRDILLASLLGFYLLQSLFINDYFYRKPVIMLPMVLLLIAISAAEYRDFIEYLRNNYKLLVAYKCYIVLCICCALGILLINSSEKLVAYDALSGGISVLLPIFIFQLLFIFILLTRRKTTPKYLVTIALILIMIPNIYLSTRYIYVNPSYSYKKTMLQLSDYIDNEIVVGGMAHGFRLYNTSIPIINPYTYMYADKGMETYKMLLEQIIDGNVSRYIVLYIAEDKNTPKNAFYATNEVYRDKIDLVFEFDLKNTERGEKPCIGLYKYR
jgi:F0F1-type ATP synthase assembly protein I